MAEKSLPQEYTDAARHHEVAKRGLPRSAALGLRGVFGDQGIRFSTTDN
jgi:hypothetical protein